MPSGKFDQFDRWALSENAYVAAFFLRIVQRGQKGRCRRGDGRGFLIPLARAVGAAQSELYRARYSPRKRSA